MWASSELERKCGVPLTPDEMLGVGMAASGK